MRRIDGTTPRDFSRGVVVFLPSMILLDLTLSSVVSLYQTANINVKRGSTNCQTMSSLAKVLQRRLIMAKKENRITVRLSEYSAQKLDEAKRKDILPVIL